MTSLLNPSLRASAASELLEDRILGMWLGKSIGGTLGLPREGATDPGVQTFYDPVPDSAPPNDDLELQLVWLHLLESAGASLDAPTLARGWLDHIHYMWDEYGRCRWNLRRGIGPEASGTWDNPFQSSMGSPIRSEIWAAVHPGHPEAARAWAELDASLDHGREGIAGEVFLADLQSRLLGGESLADALDSAYFALDSSTETAAALGHLRAAHDRQPDDPWGVRDRFLMGFGHANFTHAPLNLGLTLWALLYGHGRFEESILLAVNAGYDTDCTAATVGAVLGIHHGARALPEKWRAPIGDAIFIGPGIQNIEAPQTLGELTARTIALSTSLCGIMPPPVAPAEQGPWQDPAAVIMEDTDGLALASWSNGELPAQVKRRGAARWTWTVPPDAAGRVFRIIILSDTGATLAINDETIIDLPPDLPYVPATHRGSDYSTWVRPRAGKLTVSLRLGPGAECRRASVILADDALHFAPWNGVALPHPHQLPPSDEIITAREVF